MLNMNLDQYGNITKEEALQEFDWGYDVSEESPVLVSIAPKNNVFIGCCYDGNWCCEIEGYEDSDSWNMIGQGFGSTAERALEAAVLDIVGSDAMRENQNCEDAVNVAAYEAYQYAYGKTAIWELDQEEMDRLLYASRNYVKSHCRFFGFEWEEF